MQSKIFSFKLAEKNPGAASRWKVRDGVSLAGCSEWGVDTGEFRYVIRRLDNGPYC
ncbi:MAG: hypothetical protein QOJ91_2835 [Sphingomonadales bacterium]|nr:hypothetical protein [Sphingomonadales bacterium]